MGNYRLPQLLVIVVVVIASMLAISARRVSAFCGLGARRLVVGPQGRAGVTDGGRLVSTTRTRRLYATGGAADGDEGGQGSSAAPKGRPRGGPRKRRMSNRDEEEYFASLSSAIPADPSRPSLLVEGEDQRGAGRKGRKPGPGRPPAPPTIKASAVKKPSAPAAKGMPKAKRVLVDEGNYGIDDEDDIPVQQQVNKIRPLQGRPPPPPPPPPPSATKPGRPPRVPLADVVRQVDDEAAGSRPARPPPAAAVSVDSEWDEDEEMEEEEEEEEEFEFSGDDTDAEFLSKIKDIKVVDYNWDGRHTDDESLSDTDYDSEGGGLANFKPQSMEERLRQAQGSSGGAYNPWIAAAFGAESSVKDSSSSNKKKKKKVEEASDDEGEPREEKYRYKLVLQALSCPGCGNAFQNKHELAPGYLPPDIFARMQAKRKDMDAQAKKARQMAKEVTADDEIEMLIQRSKERAKGGGSGEDLFQGLSPEEEVEMLVKQGVDPLAGMVGVMEGDVEDDADQDDAGKEVGEEAASDMEEDDPDRMVICQRCHRLKHYGQVEDTLRPGWSDNAMLTPQRFRDIVGVIAKKRCVVVCLVDIFDFHGSLLYNLGRVVGKNPLLVAANKADLLPSDISEQRVKSWIKHELDGIGVRDTNTRNIFLVSCKTGMGILPLVKEMKRTARMQRRDLYVIGAANVGKSTFINKLMEVGRSGGSADNRKKRKGKKATELVTTSALPGTTLDLIEVDLGDRVSLYDTPGLIIPHQITTKLNTEELRCVIPQKRINHVTLRLSEGKSVLLGGLVRLDMVEGRPFLFTFYVSNEVKLHQTSTDRADEFLEKHIGNLIFPPYSLDRLKELGPMVPREFDIQGQGWKTSSIDLVISGLGWVSVTGAQGCKVRVMAPETVGVRLREPLLPYETWDTTARWAGLRAIKTKAKKGGSR